MRPPQRAGNKQRSPGYAGKSWSHARAPPPHAQEGTRHGCRAHVLMPRWTGTLHWAEPSRTDTNPPLCIQAQHYSLGAACTWRTRSAGATRGTGKRHQHNVRAGHVGRGERRQAVGGGWSSARHRRANSKHPRRQPSTATPALLEQQRNVRRLGRRQLRRRCRGVHAATTQEARRPTQRPSTSSNHTR